MLGLIVQTLIALQTWSLSRIPQGFSTPLPTLAHSKDFSFFGAGSSTFQTECILDEGTWELAACQINTIICLLGLKQIRLGVPKVPGPLLAGDVEFSERVTSLMEIHFNQNKIHSPTGHVHSFLICVEGMSDSTFSPGTEKRSCVSHKHAVTFGAVINQARPTITPGTI